MKNNLSVKNFILKYWFISVVIILTLPAVSFLAISGFPTTDDGNWMIIRFSSFYQEFMNGQIPVRFLTRLNFGYGYPVANFLYPGFMYFAIPLAPLVGFINATKLVIVFSFIISSSFIYLWLQKIFTRFAALFGTIVFTYLPYHLFDLYKRGSVGEIFAFVWVAFCLWMVEEKNPFLLSIGAALLAISHNTIFILFLPLIFLYAILRKAL